MAKYREIFHAKNTEAIKMGCKMLEDFNLWGDSKCQLIDEFKYQEMIRTGELKDRGKRFAIGKGQIGIITLSRFSQYSTTYNEMIQSLNDFRIGWKAATKYWTEKNKA